MVRHGCGGSLKLSRDYSYSPEDNSPSDKVLEKAFAHKLSLAGSEASATTYTAGSATSSTAASSSSRPARLASAGVAAAIFAAMPDSDEDVPAAARTPSGSAVGRSPATSTQYAVTFKHAANDRLHEKGLPDVFSVDDDLDLE